MRQQIITIRTDWFAILTDLQHAGKSNAEVARLIDVPRNTVWGWKDGAEPKYGDGSRLLVLWSMETGKGLEARPTKQEVRAPR